MYIDIGEGSDAPRVYSSLGVLKQGDSASDRWKVHKMLVDLYLALA